MGYRVMVFLWDEFVAWLEWKETAPAMVLWERITTDLLFPMRATYAEVVWYLRHTRQGQHELAPATLHLFDDLFYEYAKMKHKGELPHVPHVCSW